MTQNLTDKLYVQYGCGWAAPDGWVNFDASPTLRFERIPLLGALYTKNEGRFPENVHFGDIVKGLPLPPESCVAVYCSHVLEHLSLHDLRVALKNTHKLLKPGGTFRLVVPDLEYIATEYLHSRNSIEFMRETYLGLEERPKGMKGLLQMWLGNSRHLWMWDFATLKLELESAGFTSVRRAYFNDSGVENFKLAESFDRWKDCLGIECIIAPAGNDG